MYFGLFIYFLYYNLQFISDTLYKQKQIEFIKTVDLQLFMLFNFYSFITLLLHINEKTMRIKYLEIPSKKYIFKSLSKKITKMSKYWCEDNTKTKLQSLINNTQNVFYNKIFLLIELYGSIIRTIINSYMLYNLYQYSLYIIFSYFILYILFYYYVILNNRTIIKNNNKKSNQYCIKNNNLYLTYFNSCIGNYQTKYLNLILNNKISILDYSIKNESIDKYYLGSLQIFQKLLVFIFMLLFLINNDTKQSFLLLPLYQTITTFVYQFEYILHNINSFVNQDDTMFNNFLDNYKEETEYKKNICNTSNNLIKYDLKYNNKKTLNINQNFNFKSQKTLIQGHSGIGKSSLCKIISGYFPDFSFKNSHRTLYIPQDIYLHFENRTLYNVITQNDYNIYENKPILFKQIINNIVPFFDIIENFDLDYKTSLLTGKSFSGGQEKRIYLAMWFYYLLIHNNQFDLIILDEPDKSLDKNTFNVLLNNILNSPLLKTFNIIIVSHNIDLEQTKLFDNIINLKKKDNNLIID